MKASLLIELLKEAIEDYGDIDVFMEAEYDFVGTVKIAYKHEYIDMWDSKEKMIVLEWSRPESNILYVSDDVLDGAYEHL